MQYITVSHTVLDLFQLLFPVHSRPPRQTMMANAAMKAPIIMSLIFSTFILVFPKKPVCGMEPETRNDIGEKSVVVAKSAFIFVAGAFVFFSDEFFGPFFGAICPVCVGQVQDDRPDQGSILFIKCSL